MSEAQWAAVDGYIADMLVGEDEALAAALRESEAAGLPAIQVSANQGKLLHLLARTMGARRVLEIGTLGGYSAIWLGRAIAAGPVGRPAGGQNEGPPRLITLEADRKHAELARRNIARAGLSGVVEVREGWALELLPALEKEATGGSGPFDLIFIDADKEHNADYFGWAMKLCRPGSLIVVDNVVRKGAIVDRQSTDISVQGTRRLYEAIRAEKRVSATAVQTVGGKGYDGFAVAVVLEILPRT